MDSDSELANEYFNQDICIQMAVTKNAFLFDKMINNNQASREDFKTWFNEYKNIFEQTRLIDYFIEENKTEVAAFREKMNNFYQYIVKHCI